MAGTFYRLIKKAQQETKFYGFDKISREKEAEIVQRLQRETVSSTAAKSVDERSIPSHNVSRVSSAYTCTTCSSDCLHRIMCPKYDDCAFDDGFSTVGRSETISRVSTAKDLDRVISRLQTPTLSFGMKRRVIYESDEEPEPKPPPRVLSEKEMRSLSALNRPTYSRKAKLPWLCTYCDEHPDNAFKCECQCRCRKKLIDKYGEEGARNYVKKIIERVSRPTTAVKIRTEPEEAVRKRNRRKCNRTLPLISGLDRSKDIEEVVDRLYSTQCHNAQNDGYCYRTVHVAQNHRRPRIAPASTGPIVFVYQNELGHQVRKTIYEKEENADGNDESDEDIDIELERRERQRLQQRLRRKKELSHDASEMNLARRFSDDSSEEAKARRKRNGSIGSDDDSER